MTSLLVDVSALCLVCVKPCGEDELSRGSNSHQSEASQVTPANQFKNVIQTLLNIELENDGFWPTVVCDSCVRTIKMWQSLCETARVASIFFQHQRTLRGLQPAAPAACEMNHTEAGQGDRTGTKRPLEHTSETGTKKAHLENEKIGATVGRPHAPVAGRGMELLQRMGWRPGEGLGKNKEGSVEPIKQRNIKLDKKGLVAQEEVHPKIRGGEVFTGKHPVSALVELCAKRHWETPHFDIAVDTGPVHKKSYVYKVTVNNKDYQPNVVCANKKEAKALAAQDCLEQLGLTVNI